MEWELNKEVNVFKYKFLLGIGIFLTSISNAIIAGENFPDSFRNSRIVDIIANNADNIYLSRPRQVFKFKNGKEAIRIDSSGKLAADHKYLYVCDKIKGLQRFDILTGYPTSFAQEAEINSETPNEVAIDNSGKIYLSSWGRIKRYDSNGALDASWGNNGQIATAGTARIKTDSFGNIYLSANTKILKYSPRGNLDESFGDKGTVGSFKNITGICLDEENILYVTDCGSIFSFSTSGKPLKMYPASGKPLSCICIVADKIYAGSFTEDGIICMDKTIDGIDFSVTAYAGKVKNPLFVDGKLDDYAWRNSIWLPLTINGNGFNTAEKTYVSILHDSENIYIGFECYFSELDPVLNLGEENAPVAKKRDDDLIFKDDCVEVFIAENGEKYFHIATNGLGTIYDAYCTNDGNSIDTGWNCKGMDIKAFIEPENKRWTAELKIPLSSLNLQGFSVRANFCREFSRKKIQSALSKTNASFHKVDKFAKILQGDEYPEIKILNCIPEESRISTDIMNPGEKSLSVDIGIFFNDASFIEKHFNIPAHQRKNIEIDSNKNARIAEIKADGKRIYSFPLLSEKQKEEEIFLNLKLNREASLYFNNNLQGKSATFNNLKLNCHSGANTLALKIDTETQGDETKIEGNVIYRGDVLPLSKWLSARSASANWQSPLYDDSKWKLVLTETGTINTNSSGGIFLRKNLVLNHTTFSPQWGNDNKKGYFAQGTIQSTGVRLSSPFVWAVSNMTLNILLPKEIRLDIYQPELRKYSKYSKSPAVIKEIGDNVLYEIIFPGPIPKLNHSWGPNTLNLYFNVDCIGEGKSLIEKKGRIWFDWRSGADIELANKLEIVLLPKPCGIQPENIPIYIAAPNINALISNEEASELLKTFKICGINGVFIDGSHGPLAYFIDRARKLDVKIMHLLISNRKYATYEDITKGKSYVQNNKDSALINQHYKKSPYEAPMCPLYFMNEASPFVKEKLQRQAEQGVDSFLFDIEFSPLSSCYCERCRKKFSEFMNDDKIYSQAEILKEHRNKWCEYVSKVHGDMAVFYKNILNGLPKPLPLGVYSGYHNGNIQSTYGMNWTLYKDSANIFMAGYGRNPSAIKETMALIGNKKMILGEHLNTGGISQYEKPYLEKQKYLKSIIFRRLTDGKMGGFFLWDWLEVDGLGWFAIGEATRAVATFEKVLLSGENPDIKKLCQGITGEDIFAYQKGNEMVFILFNDNSDKGKDFSISLPADRKYQIWNFYEGGEKSNVSGIYKSQVPAHDTAVIRISPL